MIYGNLELILPQFIMICGNLEPILPQFIMICGNLEPILPQFHRNPSHSSHQWLQLATFRPIPGQDFLQILPGVSETIELGHLTLVGQPQDDAKGSTKGKNIVEWDHIIFIPKLGVICKKEAQCTTGSWPSTLSSVVSMPHSMFSIDQ